MRYSLFFGGIKHSDAITPVCWDVYLDGATRINREFPPVFETDYERHVVSLQLGNSPDGSHCSPVDMNSADTSRELALRSLIVGE